MSDHVSKYAYHPFFDQMVLVSPPVDQFISLTQALSWIAYSCFVDPRTLYVALDLAHGDELEDAHVRLTNAAKLLMRRACSRRLLLKGRHATAGIGPLAITPVEQIDSEVLWDYRRFDLFIDGLGLGTGIAWPLSPDEDFYRPSQESFHNVSVEFTSFWAEFSETAELTTGEQPELANNTLTEKCNSVRSEKQKPGPRPNENWPEAIESVTSVVRKSNFCLPLKRGQKAKIQKLLLEEMASKNQYFSDAIARKHAEQVIAALPNCSDSSVNDQ